MTVLNKPVTRATKTALGSSFGPDRDRAIVVTLIPGNGEGVPDLINLKPHRTRRVESLPIEAVYRYAIMCRVNCARLEKARAKKDRLKAQRERAAIARADRKLSNACKQ